MRKNYDQDFIDEAVGIALNSNHPYSEIALDLGVNYQIFGNWMRKAMSTRNDPSPKDGKVDKQSYQALERELRASRKELALRKLVTARTERGRANHHPHNPGRKCCHRRYKELGR